MKILPVFLVFAVLLSPVAAAKKSAEDLLARAQTACERKSYKKCVSLSQKALDLQPHSADAYYWKARGLEGSGKLLEAANEYKAALLVRENFQEANEGLIRVSSLLEPGKTGVVGE